MSLKTNKYVVLVFVQVFQSFPDRMTIRHDADSLLVREH